VDTLNNKMVMGIRDTLRGFFSFIVIDYPLVDFDLPMGPTGGFGKVTAQTGYFSGAGPATFGNFSMRVNPDKTVCGNFFWHNKDAKIFVNQGQFSNMPYKYN
jgi:hypothetical protein